MNTQWEYRGEGIYVFWFNPFNDGRKEDLFMFLWPCHAIADTKRVESLIENMATEMCQAWNTKAQQGVDGVTNYGICSICRREQIGAYHEHPCE